MKFMNRQEIKEKIAQNLEEGDRPNPDVRVQLSYTGWQIAVISEVFENLSFNERRELTLDGLGNLNIEWIDLLTPTERELAGNLPAEQDPENLPLWPEALLRGQNYDHASTILFPSDLDEDIDPPIVATFYSLRGGVGRSTALAYTAQILARRGYTVLCIDLDLEAPGLAALFGRETEIPQGCGIVSLLTHLDSGGNPNLQRHLLRLSEVDELYCLPAGRPDAEYARQLALLDPIAWYQEDRNPLHELIDRASRDLTFKPDIILLDARTGIAPFNAPLLFDLADLAFITFFPHPQTQVGTGALVQALLAAKSRRQRSQPLTPEPRFIVSPIPSSKAPEVIERYRHRAVEWIDTWLNTSNINSTNTKSIEAKEVTHFIPYREVIATSDQILGDYETWQDYDQIADWIAAFLPTDREQKLIERVPLSDVKANLLEELQFSSGLAERQENFLETFVPTEHIEKALRPDISLILGRKGTGKTALFRRILEDPQRSRSRIVVMAPTALKRNCVWVLSQDGFREIEKILNRYHLGWREFWILQVCFASFLSPDIPDVLPDSSLSGLLPIRSDDLTLLNEEIKIIDILMKLMEVDRIGLLARDWLRRIDEAVPQYTFLLFDGIDTGFGNSEDDRRRRASSLEGLLSTVVDIGLENLRFKIVLREDIYRKLSFENKSHFYGRDTTLSWKKRIDFFKVPIKQALQAKIFRDFIAPAIVNPSLIDNCDYWGDQQVAEVWNLLLGERMRSGNAAFTQNWVWRRLTDANDDRSPRFILQLFQEAKEWEKQEIAGDPYFKTIIRPRALIESLPKISQAAADALVNEEFPELESLVKHLKSIGRSPVEARELENFTKEVELARELGLMGVYEEQNGQVVRYKIPDLYRIDFGMTRSGQA